MTNGDQPEKRDENRGRAEQRVRDEMTRHRRAEQAQLKSLKFGCIGVILALVLAMVISFFF